MPSKALGSRRSRAARGGNGDTLSLLPPLQPIQNALPAQSLVQVPTRTTRGTKWCQTTWDGLGHGTEEQPGPGESCKQTHSQGEGTGNEIIPQNVFNADARLTVPPPDWAGCSGHRCLSQITPITQGPEEGAKSITLQALSLSWAAR